MSAHRVVAVVSSPPCLFELGLTAELFGLPRPEVDVPWYEFRAVAAGRAASFGLGGIVVGAEYDPSSVEHADTIVVPGWGDLDIAPHVELLDAIRTAHAGGARVMSICSGVFVLAASGLLDGRAATTHWRYVDRLAREFPNVDVRPDVLFVDDGQVLSSAGSAAGIDLGLHVIRTDHGASVAASVARRLVVPPQRDGGQAQFTEHLRDESAGTPPVAAAQEWMRAHFAEAVTVEAVARRVHLSPRTFARRFRAELGTPPMRWLTSVRVDTACRLLETTELSVEEIARRVGFASADTLRHHIRRTLDTTPSRYRRHFATAAVGADATTPGAAKATDGH